MESNFEEDWILKNSSYPAIAIDKLAIGSKVMRGGNLVDANTVVFVRLDIFNGSQVKKGDRITVRGTDVIVLEIDSDGDDSRSLVCGPAQIDVW